LKEQHNVVSHAAGNWMRAIPASSCTRITGDYFFFPPPEALFAALSGLTLMVLAEQEFDREGAQVMGVSIENHNLQPGETTNVFVIRQEAMR